MNGQRALCPQGRQPIPLTCGHRAGSFVPMGYRVGVDIGGTFTDFCVLDEATGAIRTLKVLSMADRPGSEVIAGLRELERRTGIRPADITYFTHGTTVGVNTVIQRKGARLALFA